MNWLKGKEIYLLILVLLVGVSVVYYTVYLPNQKEQKQEFIFEMKQKCSEAGKKLYEEDVKELGSSNVFNPEYHYNQKLNTCLYSGGQIQKGYFAKWVTDSLTNKWVIAFIEIGEGDKRSVFTGCAECLSSSEEFGQQKQKLFSE